MTFIRVVEDFDCEHCGTHVTGTGYTNHCPHCLWSKHVDNEPGDRKATCGGAMQPLRLEGSTPDYRIVHRCERCGSERHVTIATNDNAEALVALAQKNSVA